MMAAKLATVGSLLFAYLSGEKIQETGAQRTAGYSESALA
jgi:hypothetical protein